MDGDGRNGGFDGANFKRRARAIESDESEIESRF
jgi:hypothetical protein